ncbi:uncharacterized protein PG986_000962 [Apiospora aurea]|uniref:Uncharacterized protein n=1 Tax=Apiospora aurea TaxID=335848 RepID=A0ABR1QVH1_9PEZI
MTTDHFRRNASSECRTPLPGIPYYRHHRPNPSRDRKKQPRSKHEGLPPAPAAPAGTGTQPVAGRAVFEQRAAAAVVGAGVVKVARQPHEQVVHMVAPRQHVHLEPRGEQVAVGALAGQTEGGQVVGLELAGDLVEELPGRPSSSLEGNAGGAEGALSSIALYSSARRARTT